MTRKSILEELRTSTLNIPRDVKRIDTLFTTQYITVEYHREYTTAKEEVEKRFLKYPFRVRCTSLADLRESLNLNYFEDTKEDFSKFISYLELMINLIKFLDDNLNSYMHSNSLLNAITENIKSLLSDLNYEIRENDGFRSLHEKNPVATAVTEKILITEPKRAIQVFEYNHHTLRGNLKRKKEILSALYPALEALEERGHPYKQMIKDATYLLNNLNIRHDNTDTPKVKDMIDNHRQELEEWYDKTYHIVLLALLGDDIAQYQQEVKELKIKLGHIQP